MKKCLACGLTFQSSGWKCLSCGSEPEEYDGCPLFAPDMSRESQSYDAERHRTLEEVENTHFWFLNRTDMVLWAFRKYFADASSYLEAGCGTGFILRGLRRAFPNVRMVGSELLLSGLERARRNLSGLELLQMDVLAIPYENEFSVIGAYDVIEHIADDIGALRQFWHALADNGGLILTVPQHPSLWSRHDERARHLRRYVASELVSKIEAAGFRMERLTSLYCSTVPLMWWSRRMGGANSASRDEFHLAPWLNRSMHALLSWERVSIRLGLDLPLGGSLLAVARKAG